MVAELAMASAIAASAQVRMQLMHTDAGRGLTPRELLHRMAQRSRARAERLGLFSQGASVPVTPGKLDASGVPDTEYLAHLSIGTPAQPVQLILDSGSDLIWTQCLPCVSCFHQALSVFNASLSSTFAELPCGSPACQDLPATSCSTGGSSSTNNTRCVYRYSYGDGSVTMGGLVGDTFVFSAGAAVPAMAFGCGLNNTGFSSPTRPASLGLDAAPCLYHPNSSSSARGVVQTTPFTQNPANQPTFYYLSLKGITVGSTMLPIPESRFTLTNGTGGTIIDSGTGMTTFPPDVYNLVHDAFIAQASLPVVNATETPLCFTSPDGTKLDVPKLILHFDGATMDLPQNNYMFELEDEGVRFTCLAAIPGGNPTIIGNYQQ
ncbi:hypothetical protein QOZ80_3AG0246170 [Eleusine coracana subsp. coracana]|nr:hypothetical protein QOZ80_3AG0246170 [Eleusine coracana subsp. coracana]